MWIVPLRAWVQRGYVRCTRQVLFKLKIGLEVEGLLLLLLWQGAVAFECIPVWVGQPFEDFFQAITPGIVDHAEVFVVFVNAGLGANFKCVGAVFE